MWILPLRLLHHRDPGLLLIQLARNGFWKVASNLLLEETFRFSDILRPVVFRECKDLVPVDLSKSITADRALLWQKTDWAWLGDILVVNTSADPIDDPDVLTISGPQESPIVVKTEPVDMEDLRHLAARLVKTEPVAEIVTKVVSHERPHCHWIVHDLFTLVLSCCGCFGLQCCPHHHSMLPIKRLIHQGHTFWSSPSKHDCIDRNSLCIFPLGMDYRALIGWCTEPGVWMCCLSRHSYLPFLTEPGRHIRLWVNLLFHSFPEATTIIGHSNIREVGVLHARLHCHWIRLHVGTWCHAKEASLRIDGTQATIFVEPHPGNVISDALHLPPWK